MNDKPKPDANHDFRHLENGWRIPALEGGYSDQPYVVVNADGSWTCVMTVGAGHEGQSGQHIIATRSEDRGRTWSDPVPIEPPDGPEASWAQPLRVPQTGRIYVFYTYNAENRRVLKNENGEEKVTRVDSFGTYAYRYSDDGGRTWSADRYTIPMRPFEIDRENVYGGEIFFFWGVGKPIIHEDEAFIPYSKVGAFGRGFFTRNEGALLASPNLLTEHDPSRHEWLTLPEGEVGLRAPEGGGPIAGELYVTPMNDGSLFGTFRTLAGYAACAYSRDRGRSWEVDWMRYRPGGRRMKNPRSANFVWRCTNGKYLYWFNNHGGETLARVLRDEPEKGYAHRNPTWLCGGVERDGRIYWSQPEIVLYEDNIGLRWSYPDLIEQDGRHFLTETQKTVARVHEIDPSLLERIWQQVEAALAPDTVRAPAPDEAPVLEHAGPGTVEMPELPKLHDRGSDRLDPQTGATLPGEAGVVRRRGGFTLALGVRLETLEPWQMLLDSRDAEGRGMTVMLTDRGTLKLSVIGRCFAQPGATWAGGMCESSWDCDPGLLEAGRAHQVVFVVDGGPRLVSVLVDGELCDGGDQRQFGWGRFHPNLKEADGAETARVGRGVAWLRVYDRALSTAACVALAPKRNYESRVFRRWF